MKSIRYLAKQSVFASALLVLAGPTSANFIANGGFENPDVAQGKWKYFTDSGVPGWNGSNMEIWDDFNGVTASEGEQFAELNAHPGDGNAFSIYQDFTTVANQWYDLSFAYRARRNSNEAFSVSAGNFMQTLNDHGTGNWSAFSGSFQATGTTSRLKFTSVNPKTGTVGNFLDGVSVTAKVPEPGTLALLGLGLAGLGVARSRR